MSSWNFLEISPSLFFAAHLTTQATTRAAEVTKDDALIISIIGLVTVFSGLLILFLAMTLLTWFFEPAEEKVEAIPEEEEETWEDVWGKEEEEEEAEEVVIPPKDPSLVPVSLLAAAIMAYHLHEIGKLPLGKKVELQADEKSHTVKILSLGYYNRVLVDDEEVVFNVSEVATSDEPK